MKVILHHRFLEMKIIHVIIFFLFRNYHVKLNENGTHSHSIFDAFLGIFYGTFTLDVDVYATADFYVQCYQRDYKLYENIPRNINK